jgi:sulfur-oxidizing protein SoxX
LSDTRERRNAATLSRRFSLRSFLVGVVLAVPAVGIAQSGLERPLTAEPGDAARGRSIVFDKSLSSCVLCHAVPGNEGPQGNVGPPLEGVGSRLSEAQLRLRIVDSTRINPASVMPPYHRTEGLSRVAGNYRDKPVLDARQVEDVVAYLRTLK